MGRQVDSGAPGRGEAEQVPGRHLALGPGEQQPGGRPPPEGQAGDGLRGALHGVIMLCQSEMTESGLEDNVSAESLIRHTMEMLTSSISS